MQTHLELDERVDSQKELADRDAEHPLEAVLEVLDHGEQNPEVLLVRVVDDFGVRLDETLFDFQRGRAAQVLDDSGR